MDSGSEEGSNNDLEVQVADSEDGDDEEARSYIIKTQLRVAAKEGVFLTAKERQFCASYQLPYYLHTIQDCTVSSREDCSRQFNSKSVSLYLRAIYFSEIDCQTLKSFALKTAWLQHLSLLAQLTMRRWQMATRQRATP